MNVGFKYTSGKVHGTGSNSTILTELYKWYTNNLKKYEDKIGINEGFCNDREPSTSNTTINGSGGTGTTKTWYGAYIRLEENKLPILICAHEDLYTMAESNKGNKSLENPVGLITADEVSFSGGKRGKQNKSYYLYTGQVYWTLSPAHYNGISSNGAHMFIVDSSGNQDWSYSSPSLGIRPVINLKADTKFTFENGDENKGSMTNPYIVVGGNS